jgi:hypothetical protein
MDTQGRCLRPLVPMWSPRICNFIYHGQPMNVQAVHQALDNSFIPSLVRILSRETDAPAIVLLALDGQCRLM